MCPSGDGGMGRECLQQPSRMSVRHWLGLSRGCKRISTYRARSASDKWCGRNYVFESRDNRRVLLRMPDICTNHVVRRDGTIHEPNEKSQCRRTIREGSCLREIATPSTRERRSVARGALGASRARHSGTGRLQKNAFISMNYGADRTKSRASSCGFLR